MPHTFTSLRQNLAPPTPDEVATAIENELRGLAAEFGLTASGGFLDTHTQAMRLACDALVKMDRRGSLAALLTAYRLGDQNAVMAGLGEDRSSALELAADMLTDAADLLADKWRSAARAAA